MFKKLISCFTELDLEKTHKDHQSQDILWFSWLKQGS